MNDTRRRRGRSAFVAALALIVTAGVGTGAMGATITLDDFEGDFGDMTGELAATGEVTATPKPKTVLGFRLSAAGTGGCDHLVGGSTALCGADTRKWAGPDGAVLRYGLDFRRVSTISFDLAAFSDSDPFDHYDDDNATAWGDFLRVVSLIGGTRTILAEFTGVPMSARTPETAFGMVSTSAGASLGEGIIADASFDTIDLRGFGGLPLGFGELVFEIRSTGSSEQIGLDNIRISPVPVPVPGALSASGLGLAAFVACGYGKRRRKT